MGFVADSSSSASYHGHEANLKSKSDRLQVLTWRVVNGTPEESPLRQEWGTLVTVLFCRIVVIATQDFRWSDDCTQPWSKFTVQSTYFVPLANLDLLIRDPYRLDKEGPPFWVDLVGFQRPTSNIHRTRLL